MSVVLLGSTSGSVTLQEPAVAGSTVVNLPSTIGNASTSAMVTTDASGNVGIGVTPSAWGSGFKALQIGARSAFFDSSTTTLLGNNTYYDGSNYKYIATAAASLYDTTAGLHRWYNAASGTAGNTVSFTTAMTLNANGALALQGASTSANGVGITFPSTDLHYSTNANTLDDYEEGTWTPTIIGSSTAGTATYSIQSGTYTKIGRVVQVQLFVGWTGGTGTGNLQISGLPFTSNSSTNNYAWANGYSTNLALTANNIFYAAIANGNTIIGIDQYPAGGGAATNVPYDAAAQLGISLVYQV